MYKNTIIRIKEANSNFVLIGLVITIVISSILIISKVNKLERTPVTITQTDQINYEVLSKEITRQKIELESKCPVDQIAIKYSKAINCYKVEQIYINSEESGKPLIKSLIESQK